MKLKNFRFAPLSIAAFAAVLASCLALGVVADEASTVGERPDRSLSAEQGQAAEVPVAPAEESEGDQETPGSLGGSLEGLTMPTPTLVCYSWQCSGPGTQCGKRGDGVCVVQPGDSCGICEFEDP